MGDEHDRRNQVQRRRRGLQARMPSHYCPTCTAVAYEEDERCLECDTERPDGYGWPALRDSLDPWLGRVLDGRYLLTKRIGQGASASVYRAESLAILRQFAVKIIHPAKATNGPTPEQIAARLEREIEALGRLRNPHVVRFTDVIELPLNHIGVVMDFVQGDTLEALVERGGALHPDRAIELLRQTCNGVYEAHITGLTHRDLKPENIMVERLPAGGDFVHVLDFGIVHLDGEITMTQGFIGTPLYASPEQAMGEVVDHRSDIYSLGAIFFFMLTGRPPFLGNHVMQVLRQHVEREPPDLTETRGDGVNLDHLGTLVKRMLAKDIQSRPQDLQQVIDSLDQVRLFDRQDSGAVSAPSSNAAGTMLGHGATSLSADTGDVEGEEE
ncbi:MAG: serine/threonine-protein kinase, partial [Myxococcota bacterium]